eukprot:GHVP01020485.1.p2 GENE.GHVP01020485.1~~GHVP01020485.1.p2  ORF type:complete len:103 (+),score=15.98 GHVP01020485.1:284-592(+)
MESKGNNSDNVQKRYKLYLEQSSKKGLPTSKDFPDGYEVVVCEPEKGKEIRIFGKDPKHLTTFYRVKVYHTNVCLKGLEKFEYESSDEYSDLEQVSKDNPDD